MFKYIITLISTIGCTAHLSYAQTQEQVLDYMGDLRKAAIHADYCAFKSVYWFDQEELLEIIQLGIDKNPEYKELYDIYTKPTLDNLRMRKLMEEGIFEIFSSFPNENESILSFSDFKIIDFKTLKTTDEFSELSEEIETSNVLIIFENKKKEYFYTYIEDLVTMNNKLYAGQFTSNKISDKHTIPTIIDGFENNKMYEISYSTTDEVYTEVVADSTIIYTEEAETIVKKYKTQIDGINYTFEIHFKDSYVIRVDYTSDDKKINHSSEIFNYVNNSTPLPIELGEKIMYLYPTENGNLNGSLHLSDNNNILSTVTLYQIVK